MTEPMPTPEASRYRWYHKVSAMIFIVFCLELGLFLVVFPWSDFWERSWFSGLAPEWHAYWLNAYLRGAISGVGFVNVYISIVEIFRLRRFTRH